MVEVYESAGRRGRRIVASNFSETEVRFEGWDSQTNNYLVAK